MSSPQLRKFSPMAKGHLSLWEWKGFTPIRVGHCLSMSGEFLGL